MDFVTHYGGAQRSNRLLVPRPAAVLRVRVVDPYAACHEWLGPAGGQDPDPRAADSVQAMLHSATRPALRRIGALLAQVPEQMGLRGGCVGPLAGSSRISF